jgi:hypothetical protein
MGVPGVVLGKKMAVICLTLTVLSAVTAVQADLTGEASSTAAAQGLIYVSSGQDLAAASDWVVNDTSYQTLISYTVAPLDPLPSEADSKMTVKEIPAIPGSATLLLYMASGLGVYQFGRSVKRFNFETLPDWYQAGGVRQVGYARAVNVSPGLLLLPTVLAAFDKPIPDSLVTSRIFREGAPRLGLPYFVSETDVRGPPCLS